MHKIRPAGQMWPSKLNLITSARTIDRNTLRMGKNISIMALECSPEFFFGPPCDWVVHPCVKGFGDSFTFRWFIRCVPYPLTCSLEVTAQKTISVKPWLANMRKQIPPIGRPSFTSASVLCFGSNTNLEIHEDFYFSCTLLLLIALMQSASLHLFRRKGQVSIIFFTCYLSQ